MDREQEFLDRLDEFKKNYKEMDLESLDFEEFIRGLDSEDKNLKNLNSEELKSLFSNKYDSVVSLKETAEILDKLMEIEKKSAELFSEVSEFRSLGEFNNDPIEEFFVSYINFSDRIEAAIRMFANKQLTLLELSEQLTKEIKDSRQEIATIEGNIAANKRRIEEDKARIEEINYEISIAEATQTELRKVINRNKNDATLSTNERIAVERDLEKYRARLNSLRGELKVISSQDKVLEEEIIALEAKLEEARKQQEDLKEQFLKVGTLPKAAEKEEKTKSEPSIFDQDVDTPSVSNDEPDVAQDPEKEDDNEKNDEQEKKEPENVVTHNVTLNIFGPEGKQTTVVVPVAEKTPLFPHDENGDFIETPASTIFRNACVEAFGQAANYRIEKIASEVEGFIPVSTPIMEDMSVDISVVKQNAITFVDDNKVVYKLYVDDGKYLNRDQTNALEVINRSVNYQNSDAGYLGQPKDMRKGNPLKKAFTGLKYWGVVDSNNPDAEKKEKFNFDQPITEDVVLESQKGVKAKSVVSTLGGMALGSTIAIAGGPVAGKATVAVAGLVDRIAKYKLNHHKEMIGLDEIAQMTGVKKAGAKVVNHFRKTQTIKDIQFGCRGMMIGASAVEIGRGIKTLVDNASTNSPQMNGDQLHMDGKPQKGGDFTVQSNNTTGGGITETSTPSLKAGNQFEYGYRDSFSAVGGNNSVHLNTTLTGEATPHSFYDTVAREWLPINDQTTAQVFADKARYAVRYMSQNGDMMWESAADAFENIAEIGGKAL